MFYLLIYQYLYTLFFFMTDVVIKSIYKKSKKIYIVKTLFYAIRHLAKKVALSLLPQQITSVIHPSLHPSCFDKKGVITGGST